MKQTKQLPPVAPQQQPNITQQQQDALLGQNDVCTIRCRTTPLLVIIVGSLIGVAIIMELRNHPMATQKLRSMHKDIGDEVEVRPVAAVVSNLSAAAVGNASLVSLTEGNTSALASNGLPAYVISLQEQIRLLKLDLLKAKDNETRAVPPSGEGSVENNRTVAICIAGGARAFGAAKESLKVNVINALQPNPKYRKIFFDLSLENDCSANIHGTSQKAQDCAAVVASLNGSYFGSPEFMQEFQEPIIRLNNTMKCGDALHQNDPCCKVVAEALELPSRGGIYGYAHYTRKRDCLQMIMDHEKNAMNGDKFDYVVVIRPDLYFFDPVPPVSYLVGLSPRLLMSSKEHGQPPGDFLYFAHRSVVDQLVWMLAATFHPLCTRGLPRQQMMGHFVNPPEFRFEQLVHDHNHPFGFVLYQFNFVVLRSPTRGDCFRLENEVFYKARIHPRRDDTSKPPKHLLVWEHCASLFTRGG